MVALVLALWLAAPAGASAVTSLKPAANSSPIAISDDGRFVWSVNPNADTVSVIRTDTNTEIRRIATGDEPQSVALSNDNRRAFVTNAAAGTVAVIRIFDRRPARFRAGVVRRLTTGAEPWNVVVSPDSKRAFVANSSQDTITVIDVARERIIGDVNMRAGRCGDPARAKHFQPRGLAVTRDSRKLYVTSFLAFTRRRRQAGRRQRPPGARLPPDDQHELAAHLRLPPGAGDPARAAGDRLHGRLQRRRHARPDRRRSPTSCRASSSTATAPTCRTSPRRPAARCASTSTRRRSSTSSTASTACSRPTRARRSSSTCTSARATPRSGKKKLFFANAWAIAFTTRAGAGAAYVVSAGSDLLVKVNVAPDGKLVFTGDQDTTRYIDLNDPANPLTAGANAGKNPQGIAINKAGKRAYVQNFVSHNVSVVDLTTDKVIKTISTAPGPAPGSTEEAVAVGAEVFFSSRGNFQIGAASSSERLSSEGWQSCSSCHFKGLTDGVDLDVQRRPAQVRAAQRDVRPAQPLAAADPQLLGDLRRGPGLRGEHPQRLRTGRAGRGGAVRLGRDRAGDRATTRPTAC